MDVNRLRAVGAVLCAAALVLSGCLRGTSVPTDLTATSATLRAEAACAAQTGDNPCTYWFEYWASGTGTVTATPRRTANVDTGGHVAVTETVAGLAPDTVYHARLCAHGDTTVPRPGVCIGLPGSAMSGPGLQPGSWDLNNTQNFRTAGEGTSATVDLGRPLSAASRVSRDGGLSAAWSPTQSLWLFGDTSQQGGPGFLPGTTAASGPYTRGSVPTGLQELPTPPDPAAAGQKSPAPFLPAPRGLRASAAQGCDGIKPYAASWPSGVAAVPGTERLLIVYAEVCVISPTRMPTQRLTLAVYDPAANRLTESHTPFTAVPLESGLPVEQRLGSPVFGGDGFLYLYASDVRTGEITVARVGADPSSWGDPGNYRWWNGSWVTDPVAAAPVAAVPFAGSVHVADYSGQGSHRLAMIVQTEFGTGRFQILESTGPTGPWRPGPAGKVPDRCDTAGYGCYALSGHAELSTPDRFLFSWYSPNDLAGDTHLRVGSVAW